jgi:hypothetical protein
VGSEVWLLLRMVAGRDLEMSRRLIVLLQPKAMPAPKTGKGPGTGTVFKVKLSVPAPVSHCHM